MRMNRTDAAKNRERVVQTASELFRQDGYDKTGIAVLMKAAKLTNGAFYKQFDSKEALIAEATALALDENAKTWQAALEATRGDRLQAITDWYLSEPHVSHRNKGCTYAALASEAPRHEKAVRQAFDRGVRRTVGLLTDNATQTDVSEAVALRHLSRLVGALMLARAVDDPDLAERILAANRAPEEG